MICSNSESGCRTGRTAATRGYDVGFKSWMTYETLVLASSEHEAIAKGKAIYGLAGLGDFSFSDCGEGLARLGS
ncbi:hypothetical protein AAV28_33710 [Bradyrhizobium diazoefficiens USDA 110]|nr:hypothetical protein AAV28_33710 [Bradyrhizobium diazoefficiens USDA 110]BCF47214.1 hypothetical protein XF16B_77040 [Bradyrhizobium diazoefficiens]BCF73370.1 hypothetical protein XF19B_77230 [Bradyrhizobium diazoefficiens]